MWTSTSSSQPTLTPSEVVLIHGRNFADRKRPVAMLIACVAGIILGAVTSYLGTGTIVDAWASTSWPLTGGTVVSCRVARNPDAPDVTYTAHISYRYLVAGRQYKNTTVSFGAVVSSSSPAAAERIVARYPAGKAVQVAYDPADPGRAVLEPGLRLSSFVAFFAGLLFAFVLSVVLAYQLPLFFQRTGKDVA
jgi:Protein of unknown function (DUF3592)